MRVLQVVSRITGRIPGVLLGPERELTWARCEPQGDVVAANILGEQREAHYEAVPNVVYTDPQAASVGASEARFSATIPVDGHLRAAEHVWAIGDATGIRLLTHVGKYQGEVAASNILGEPREANYEAVPDVVYTDPQAAAAGASQARFSATAPLSEVAKTATYTRRYAESNGFLTLLSDGEHLTGAYALGPEAGEWMQQATLAIRARVPLTVLRDVIQPFPTFSEIYVAAYKALHQQIGAAGLR